MLLGGARNGLTHAHRLGYMGYGAHGAHGAHGLTWRSSLSFLLFVTELLLFHGFKLALSRHVQRPLHIHIHVHVQAHVHIGGSVAVVDGQVLMGQVGPPFPPAARPLDVPEDLPPLVQEGLGGAHDHLHAHQVVRQVQVVGGYGTWGSRPDGDFGDVSLASKDPGRVVQLVPQEVVVEIGVEQLLAVARTGVADHGGPLCGQRVRLLGRGRVLCGRGRGLLGDGQGDGQGLREGQGQGLGLRLLVGVRRHCFGTQIVETSNCSAKGGGRVTPRAAG